jgi:hypothetical protein
MKCRARALERDAQNTNGFGIEFATLQIDSDRHLPLQGSTREPEHGSCSVPTLCTAVAVNTRAGMNTKSSSRFGLTLGTTSETRRRHGRFRNRHFTQAEFKLEPRSRQRLRIGSVLPVHSVASWVEVPVPKLLGTSPRTECHWVYQTVQATCALRRCADWATRHPTDGNAPTLEAAKAAFQASWRQWLPWAKLGEVQ